MIVLHFLAVVALITLLIVSIWATIGAFRRLAWAQLFSVGEGTTMLLVLFLIAICSALSLGIFLCMKAYFF
jgi:hypothetical protein